MINPKLLTFLRGIKKNNKKQWYDEQKEEYKLLKNEFTGLLRDIRDEVVTFDVAVKRSHEKGIETVKVFRIHRDARFSRDKTKYKTAMSGLISADVKNPLEPVYYFAIEPGGSSFIGGGMRTPEPAQLDILRKYIAIHYKKLQKILKEPGLTLDFPAGLSTEYRLKKAPQGYETTHPAIDLLRFKNFTLGHSLADERLKDVDLKNVVSKEFQLLERLNNFLRAAGK